MALPTPIVETGPLNLWEIFVNIFAGSDTIFWFIAMILFAVLAAKFRMPNQIFLLLMVLFIILMQPFGFGLLYTITIFLIGLFFYYTLSKIIKT